MNSLEPAVEPLEFLNPGELTTVQIEIARRADELAAGSASSREWDRRRWLRAELEVFERRELAHQHAVSRKW